MVSTTSSKKWFLKTVARELPLNFTPKHDPRRPHWDLSQPAVRKDRRRGAVRGRARAPGSAPRGRPVGKAVGGGARGARRPRGEPCRERARTARRRQEPPLGQRLRVGRAAGTAPEDSRPLGPVSHLGQDPPFPGASHPGVQLSPDWQVTSDGS